jgi:hypothetical protein
VRKFISKLFYARAVQYKLDMSKTWEENEYALLLDVENLLNKESRWSRFK